MKESLAAKEQRMAKAARAARKTGPGDFTSEKALQRLEDTVKALAGTLTDSLARDEFPPLPVTIPAFNLAGQKVDLNDKETQKGILTWGKSFLNEAKNLGEALGLDKLSLDKVLPGAKPPGGPPPGGPPPPEADGGRAAPPRKGGKGGKPKPRKEVRDNAKNRWSAPK